MNGARNNTMHRLSSPIESIKANYGVVVVGSGYGGGIAASRLSRAGQRVCVLERGKEFLPGDFPHDTVEAAEEMQIDMPGCKKGPATGLYDFRVNNDIHVLVGCGLGGTSLINANVSLPPDPRVFRDERWPKELQDETAAMKMGKDGTLSDNATFLATELGRGFTRAIEMLRPTPFPSDQSLPKTDALEASAKALEKPFYRPPINVTFKDGTNHVGVEQRKCENCGDCVSGCNHFAKNTVAMNYLPDARNHGAEIFTEVSVRYVERRGGKWVVCFSQVGRGEDLFDAPPQFVLADIVFLAAGTLGSTEILLRSSARGLAVSSQLGKRFSGNGDVLAFGYNTERKINGVGFGDHNPDSIGPVGPCITGIIDARATENVKDGYVIEEGSLPGPLGKLLPGALAAAGGLLPKDPATGVLEEVDERLRQLDSFIRGPYHGAVNNTQTYLVMAHDDGKGSMRLDSADRLRVDWPGVGKEPIFHTIDVALMKATGALGGTHVSDPLWSNWLRNELITVHPLGGCPIGSDARTGVVNHKGQVYSAQDGSQVHDGLYVADGSILPTPLGLNPLLTISALAERSCALLAKDRGWKINFDPYNIVEKDQRVTVGMEWTEAMSGFFSAGQDAEIPAGGDEQARLKLLCEAAAKRGEDAKSELKFVICVTVPDADKFFKDDMHEAPFSGEVTAPALDAEALTATNGKFNLFYPFEARPETQHMRYQMNLETTAGKTYFLDGFKIIHHDKLFDLWPDTTTLYTTVYEGNDATGRVVGRGVIRLSVKQFAEMMSLMKVINAPNVLERARVMAGFAKLFLGDMLQMYGGVFARQSVFDPDAPPRIKRSLRTAPPEVHTFKTKDDLTLLLTRYRGGPKGPVILVHGLGVSSSIFSIDTIDTNMTEFLYAAGYDVWLLDFRASTDLPYARPIAYTKDGVKVVKALQFSGDDVANFDYPAAVDKVMAVTGAPSVQFVVHCFGSTTFFMSMLSKSETARDLHKKVRSFVSSQTATRPIAGPLTKLKTGLQFPALLKALGFDYLNADVPFEHIEVVDGHVVHKEKWLEKLYDDALRLYPMPIKEWCKSPVCRRIAFMYSPLYNHAQLNEATHLAMHEMFGAGNMKAFIHLGRLCNKEHLVDFNGNEVYMPNLSQLKLPICFIHGEDNRCFLPESTRLTVEELRKVNGDMYSRHVIPGYGHIDCIFGKTASRDIFPIVLQHLEETNKPY